MMSGQKEAVADGLFTGELTLNVLVVLEGERHTKVLKHRAAETRSTGGNRRTKAARFGYHQHVKTTLQILIASVHWMCFLETMESVKQQSESIDTRTQRNELKRLPEILIEHGSRGAAQIVQGGGTRRGGPMPPRGRGDRRSGRGEHLGGGRGGFAGSMVFPTAASLASRARTPRTGGTLRRAALLKVDRLARLLFLLLLVLGLFVVAPGACCVGGHI
mmetsp:Transcript_26905/g.67635  ORF Transcript_26905/g.67635 Transcript_26905/m.67635 type:complete len:218 (+) Transcript_26905:2086-2739(+)